VYLRFVELTANDHRLSQVTPQARLGPSERRVHHRQRRHQVLDGARIAEPRQAVAAPAIEVLIAQENERKRRIGPVHWQRGGRLVQGASALCILAAL
jgi:hypothetical protein